MSLISPKVPDIDPGIKREIARKRIQDTAKEYGLDIQGELDGVDVDYLEPGVKAVTTFDGVNTEITFDYSIFGRSKTEQELTALHELLHVKQFNNTLDEWLEQTFDANDLAEEVNNGYQSAGEMEGEAEVIVDALFDHQYRSPYPYEKLRKEKELGEKGIDVETELTEDIENLKNELLGGYKEIYDTVEAKNIYKEKGEFTGIEYEFTIVGEDAKNGEKEVNEYLEQLSDALEQSYLNPAPNLERGMLS